MPDVVLCVERCAVTSEGNLAFHVWGERTGTHGRVFDAELPVPIVIVTVEGESMTEFLLRVEHIVDADGWRIIGGWIRTDACWRITVAR